MTFSPMTSGGMATAMSTAASLPNTPIAEICEICAAKFRVEAHYNDRWRTPITLRPLLVEYTGGGTISEGGRTKALATFGLQDGQQINAVRPDLGSYADRAPRGGAITARLVPEGGADPKAIEAQITAELAAFADDMAKAMKPWLDRWKDKGWIGLLESLATSIRTGATEWWKSESDFWSSIGTWLSNLPNEVGAAWDNISASAKALWNNNDKIMALLQNLAKGAVDAFEDGFEAFAAVLAAIPGFKDLTQLFTDLVRNSAEWAGAMIEVMRETTVLQTIGITMISTISMIPPNFWSDMIGLGLGYIIPEVIIAVVLAIIAFFTAGTGGAALAARIAAYTGKITSALARAGRAGTALISVFNKLQSIAGKMLDLIRAVKARISEVAEGVTDRITRITRRTGSRVRDPADIPCFERPANVTAADFKQQLDEQEAAINNSDISELMRRRAIVQANGTGAVRDQAAQSAARTAWLANRTNEIRQSQGLSRAAARAMAEQEAAQLDATHVLDIVAGGDPSDISGLQNRSVNRSIGSQWRGRTGALDRALADQASQGAAKAHVRLRPC